LPTIMSYAQGLIAETSVGLKAIAVVNDRYRQAMPYLALLTYRLCSRACP